MLRRLLPLVFGMLMLTPAAARADDGDDAKLIVTRARLELTRVTKYAGEWLPTNGYPLGDVASDKGACTDLVVRALRAGGIDLQRLVHEDILRAKDAYGISVADPQVDHRRVSVLLTYFQRNLPQLSTNLRSFQPGDIVVFGPSKTTPRGHIAIISDRVGPRGLPLILEQGGPKPTEGDTLDVRPIVGHFRIGTQVAPHHDVSTVLRNLLED